MSNYIYYKIHEFSVNSQALEDGVEYKQTYDPPYNGDDKNQLCLGEA